MANRYNTNKLSFWGAYTGSVELGKKIVNMHIHIKNEMICILANMALIISRMNIDNLKYKKSVRWRRINWQAIK